MTSNPEGARPYQTPDSLDALWEDEPTLSRLPKGFDSFGTAAETAPVLLVESGPSLGRYFPLPPTGEVSVGRGKEAALRVRDRSVSRLHAIVRVTDGVVRLSDLGSLNGTWVNGRRVHAHLDAADGDRIRFGDLDVRLAWMSSRDLAYQDRVARQVRLAARDALTGLHNRHYLLESLPEVTAEARASGRPLSLATIDVDRFKRINDTFGHPTGDAVLTALARIMAASVRPSDQTVRAGGEEFWIVLQDTDGPRACRALERLRASVEATGFDELPAGWQMTISAGVAELLPEESIETWLERADRALYTAKNGGRNKVVLGDVDAQTTEPPQSTAEPLGEAEDD